MRNRLSCWLLAVLLLVVTAACAVSSTSIPTPASGRNDTQIAQPASTATFTQQIAQVSQTPAFTVTFTPPATQSQPTQATAWQSSISPPQPVVFAVIGDYGSGNHHEEDVANLVISWHPDFIITLGDNNYPKGSAGHIDEAIGQFYHSYIYPYQGSYGEGASVNRFFPTIGNHDTYTDDAQPYLDYFKLPGNERYYDFTWGPVHLFAIDNVETEPDGVGASSVQAQWLKSRLAASMSPWNIVYMHYPAYSSGDHGPTDWAVWPYASWGADAVLAGHDHTYERLEADGIPYFVNGLGGAGRYEFEEILDNSLVKYNADYGAIRVEATDTQIKFEFITREGEVIDHYELGN